MSDIRPDNTRSDAGYDLGYDLDETIRADSPARLKAVGHPLRSLILDLVLERSMTVTELAARVRKPRGSVAHHVDVLVDAGLLKVTATRRVADARAEADLSDAECAGGFTMRHARIPAELADEFAERVMALATEFTRLPRGGTREYAFLAGVFPTKRPVAPEERE